MQSKTTANIFNERLNQDLQEDNNSATTDSSPLSTSSGRGTSVESPPSPPDKLIGSDLVVLPAIKIENSDENPSKHIAPMMKDHGKSKKIGIEFTRQAIKPTFEKIYDCIVTENVDQLRKYVLDSYGEQIYSWRDSNIIITPKMSAFFQSIPEIQRKIHQLNEAIIDGDKSLNIARLIDQNMELLLSRDQTGSTPLHKAIFYQRNDIAMNIVKCLPITMETCDNQGRTPLHIAALVPDSCRLYRQLVDSGAKTSVTDMYLRRPEDYLRETEPPVPPSSTFSPLTPTSPTSSSLSSPLSVRKTGNPRTRNKKQIRNQNKNNNNRSKSDRKNNSLYLSNEFNEVENYPDHLPHHSSSPSSNRSRIVDNNTLFNDHNESILPSFSNDLNIGSHYQNRNWLPLPNNDNNSKLNIKVQSENNHQNQPLLNSIDNHLEQQQRQHQSRPTTTSNKRIESDSSERPRKKNKSQQQPKSREYLPSLVTLPATIATGHQGLINNGYHSEEETGSPLVDPSNDRENDEFFYYKYCQHQPNPSAVLAVFAGGNDGYSHPHYSFDSTVPYVPHVPSPSPKSFIVHSSSSSSMNRIINVKELIRHGNLSELEELVLQGYGDRLLGANANHAPLVQEFLDNLPNYLDQIDELHKSACHGNMRQFQLLLDHYPLILSRDPLGATVLHKAVLYNHFDLAQYISSNFGPNILYLGDNEGRTPLHYAAGLDDDGKMYRMLLKYGPKAALITDQKNNKTADFYQRSPEELDLAKILKRSKRINANYTINLANRIKLTNHNYNFNNYNNTLFPLKRKERSLSPNWNRHHRPDPNNNNNNNTKDNHYYRDGQNMNDIDDTNASTTTASSGVSSMANVNDVENGLQSNGSNMKHSNGVNVGGGGGDQHHSMQKIEINSANLKKWIQENNIEMLEGVVLEGHGDRLKQKATTVLQQDENESDHVRSKSYIEETVPLIMNKIQNIHAAVSMGDLSVLQKEGIEKRRDYILSKDHLGMTPLHKATIMGHVEVVQFILEKFPETVNARDREGRTALHYSTATTNRNGNKIYKMLIRSGADSRIRDAHGKSPDYYRVHFLPNLNESLRSNALKNHPHHGTGSGGATAAAAAGGVGGVGTNLKSSDHHFHHSHHLNAPPTQKRHIHPAIREKINQALHSGNVAQLEELLLDGYGQELLGRTSFGEDARKFLKSLPQSMDTIGQLQESVINGDMENAMKILNKNDHYIRCRDPNSFTPFHLATINGHLNLINHFAEHYPMVINLKDNLNRNALHLAAISGNSDIYRRLIELGFDPKLVDQKGKTPEHYLRSNPSISPAELSELLSLSNNVQHPIITRTLGRLQAKSNHVGQSGSSNNSPSNSTTTNDNRIVNSSPAGVVSPTSKKIGAKPSRLPALPNKTSAPPTSTKSNDVGGEVADQPRSESEQQNQQQSEAVPVDQQKPNETEEDTNKQQDDDESNDAIDQTIKVINEPDDDAAAQKIASGESSPKATQSPSNENVPETKEQNNIELDSSVVDAEGSEKPPEQSNDNVTTDVQAKIDTIVENEVKGESAISTETATSALLSPPNDQQQQQHLEGKEETKNEDEDLNDEPEPVIIYSIANEEAPNTDSLWTKIEDVDQAIVPDSKDEAGETSESAQDKPKDEFIIEEVKDENSEQDQATDGSPKGPEGGDKMESGEETKINQNQSDPEDPNKSNEESKQNGESQQTSNIVVVEVIDRNNNNKETESEAKESSDQSNADVQLKPDEDGDNNGDSSQVVMKDPQGEIDQMDSEKITETNLNESDEKTVADVKEENASNIEKDSKSDPITAKEEPQTLTSVPEEKEDEESIKNGSKSIDPKMETGPSAGEIPAEVSRKTPPEPVKEEEKVVADQQQDQQEPQPQNPESNLDQEKDEAIKTNISIIEESVNDADEQNPPEPKPENDSNEEKLQKLIDNVSNRSSARANSNVSNMNHDRLNELIKGWLEDGDLIRLEHVVIAGQGHRLLNLTSDNKQVLDFLNLVPAYMVKIKRIHETVVRGNLDEVQKTLTRKRFALCRDQYGASPLHLSVLHGHTDVLLYIITQFPETIDGPDNDGRTPLHYAAVLPDKQIYQILETAGANKQQPDRYGYTPVDYLTNGKLTIRDLLIKYALDQQQQQQQQLQQQNGTNGSDAPKADLWERPPTSEIVSQLTPESGSAPSTANDEKQKLTAEEQPDQQQGKSESITMQTGLDNSSEKEVQLLQIEPRQMYSGTMDGGQPIQQAIINGNDHPGSNPTKQEDSNTTNDTDEDDGSSQEKRKLRRMQTFDSTTKKLEDRSPVDDQIFETLTNEFNQTLRNEKQRLRQSIDQQILNSEVIKNGQNGSVIDSIQNAQQSHLKISNGISASGYDLTQIKDEHGRTVLHLAAAKDQKRSTFYKMLQQAKYLVPELDSKYRTIRDVAVLNGIKNNLQVIDQFIIDCYLKEDEEYLKLLMLEGYATLLTVVDSEGNDAVSLLERNNITSMQKFIHEAAELQKNRDELHTFIRNGYSEGVNSLVEHNPQLVVAKSIRGRTSLHIAVLFGNLEIIENLIKVNYQVINIPDNLGRTALHYAMAMSKSEEIGRILIHSGADKAIRDVRMRTPSYYFVYKQDIRDIKREEQNLTI